MTIAQRIARLQARSMTVPEMARRASAAPCQLLSVERLLGGVRAS